MGGRRGWDEWREEHGNIYTIICKKNRQWKFAGRLREPKLRLCDNLERWDAVGDGREVQKGGDICIPLTDSWSCMTESNTML